MIPPNPNPAIFIPGKTIQIRSMDDPLHLGKLAFISVENHIQHVAEMHKWLCPMATARQEAGAILHDVGKKVGVRKNLLSGTRAGSQTLRDDFYGTPIGNVTLRPEEFAKRYLAFLREDSRRMRLWPVRDDMGHRTDIRVDLSPPFGSHAADATEDDLQPFRNAALELETDHEARDYVLNLVHLHHSFQPDRIVTACARHGERFVADLYHLIVADHMGSRWAEYVVQQLEAGLETPDREDAFGDVRVSVAADPWRLEGDGEMRAGAMMLRRSRLPGELSDPAGAKLLVRYYVVGTNWNLVEELERQTAWKPRKASVGGRQKRPRRSP